MQIDRERLARVCAKALTGGSLSSPKSIDHAAVTAVLADIAAQGFVIVPRQPSENMQLHGRDAISDRISRKDDDATIWAEDAAACWQAMIDAANKSA